MVANIDVETNIEEAAKTVQDMQGEVPKGVNDAAEKIAQGFRNAATRTMLKQGSVVTGQGINSLNVKQTGRFQAGVFGAPHLQLLETGTVPHFPAMTSPRFIAAARDYGMSVPDLAQIIARKGTRPHPWMEESEKIAMRKADRKTRIELTQAVQRSR